MRAEVNEALTRQVAHLARLELTDEEIRLYTSQISDVFRYVEQLQQVDTEGVAPMTQAVPTEVSLREDVVISPVQGSDGRSKVLSTAPEVVDDGFKVPPVI